MRARVDSLRGRLALAMVAIFVVGCAASSAADLFASAYGPGSILVQEPYQDLLLLALFGCLCVPFIWIVSAWSLKGIREAARVASTIGIPDSPTLISPDRLPSEIRPLVSAINAAMVRLQQAYEVERRFVSDAAHQLRTPLTVLGLRLQKAKIDGSIDWDCIESDLATMNRLAGQLLALSQKQSARYTRTPFQCFDFARVAREAAASLAPMVEKAGRTIDVEIDGRLVIAGRSDHLRDMISCLLENAVIHGAGEIRLCADTISGISTQPLVRVLVSDLGPGVDPKIGEMAFERFKKGPGSGTGLGLAIVKEVVDGHDGRVSILSGPGCRIQVLLPMHGRAEMPMPLPEPLP